MPIDIPSGYLTRAEASKLYNRSQRALERDLDVALVTEDAESLRHWKLVTKDRQIREGQQVSTELVKQLFGEGMTPTWCVEGDYLEQRFGRKGDPKPPSRNSTPPAEPLPPTDDDQPEPRPAPQTTRDFNDTDFFKERISALELEKQQERERHDRIVAKLFEQLEVKDKQISAWDEVTQGLTRGLATGQLTPSVLLAKPVADPDHGQASTRSDFQPDQPAAEYDTESTNVEVNTDVTDAADDDNIPAKRSSARRSPSRKTKSSSTNHRQSAEKPKPKWYEMPTFKHFLSRK